ncbi:unnamed protein product [Thlaspi arvense]|uniref:FBD domain-containing protein n=1 Tax=Thlaspi arvense TaxID=13288 RepID=A0AAU9R8E8_THLAR|nr:unnamed protein product [Thlaspi arvense]
MDEGPNIEMDKISGLSDELLVKILSFLPTKVAVSTCILSKQWEFLSMWSPKLEYNENDIKGPDSSVLRFHDFVVKNLPLHRAPVVESLILTSRYHVYFQPESIKLWVGIVVSRCVRELSINVCCLSDAPMPNSLRLLLSYCPVLQDLCIERREDDNVGKIVHMPMLEEADIIVVHDVEKFLDSITSVKRLSLRVIFTLEEEYAYRPGIVYNQLEHLKLCIYSEDWSKLAVWMLRNSPKLRVLNLYVDPSPQFYHEYHPIKWKNSRRSVPECFRKSLEYLEFVGYMGTQEERDFLSFFFKHACCLKSTSIIDFASLAFDSKF